MIKLNKQNEKNSPQEYDRIFLEREKKGTDAFDKRRWKKLLKGYRGGRLIDLGCLDSLIPLYANTKFPHAEIWGIDLAPEAIRSMQDKYPFAMFEVADVYKTKYPDDYFGYAVAGEIMEHLEYPELFIKEAFRILRPGGILALSTPKEEAIEPGAVDGERHLWSYSEDDIRDMLVPYGTVEMSTLGSRYFPFYKYYFPNIIAYCKKK